MPDELFIRLSVLNVSSFAALQALLEYCLHLHLHLHLSYYFSDLDILKPVTTNAICSYNLLAWGLSAATRSFISNIP